MPLGEMPWAPTSGPTLYVMLMALCPRLEIVRLCGSALYLPNVERIEFTGLNIQSYVHSCLIDGAKVKPSEIAPLFPNLERLRLDGGDQFYGMSSLKSVVVNWVNLRSLQLSLHVGHTRSALGICSFLPVLRLLSFQSNVVEADVNTYCSRSFLMRSDVAKVRICRLTRIDTETLSDSGYDWLSEKANPFRNRFDGDSGRYFTGVGLVSTVWHRV